MDFEKIGSSHANIWWAHDNEKFSLLEKQALELLLQLEFDSASAKKAVPLIRQSYECYNKALKTKNFKEMELKHQQVMHILGFPKRNGTNYANWWIDFSERKYRKVIPALFAYHNGFFRGISKCLIPLFVLLLIIAGYGHNKRNKSLTQHFLSYYWRVILSQGKKKFILY